MSEGHSTPLIRWEVGVLPRGKILLRIAHAPNPRKRGETETLINLALSPNQLKTLAMDLQAHVKADKVGADGPGRET